MATVTVAGTDDDTTENKVGNALMPSKEKDLSLLVSKLVKQNANSTDDTMEHNKGNSNYDYAALTHVAMEIANEIRDNKTILEILPETRAAINLMVSTIKSPQTLIGTDLIWETPETPEGVEWSGNYMAELSKWFEKEWGIDTRIQKILWNCLAYTGSHPIVVVPETVVDDIINGNDLNHEVLAAENWEGNDIFKGLPFSLLDDKISNLDFPDEGVLAAESFVEGKESLTTELTRLVKSSLFFTDNIDILKKPRLLKARADAQAREVRTRNQLGVLASESYAQIENKEKSRFRTRRYGNNPLLKLEVKSNYDRLVGEGIIIEPSSTALIPVSENGPYFLLLNSNGKPITVEESESEYNTLNTIMNSGSQGAQLMQKLNNVTTGGFNIEKGKAELTVERIRKTYDNIFDEMCEKVFSTNQETANVKLPEGSEFYNILLSRALKGMRTNILFVPSDMVTYFCFDRNKYGVGESLLSKNKLLASMRASLKLADVLSGINSSIPRRSATIKIDPKDEEAPVTREVAINELIERRLTEIPWTNGISTSKITSALVRASTDVTVEHPDLPSTSIDVNDTQRDIKKPDRDLDERLRKEWFQALDTQPELIEAAFKPEFAIEYVSKNALYSKMIINRQDILEPQLTDIIRKISWLVPEVYRIIDDNLTITTMPAGITKADVVEYIIFNLSVSLPKPDGAKLDSIEKAYKTFSDFCEDAVEAYVSQDMLDRMMDGDVVSDDAMKAIHANIVMMCKREWLEQNNSIPILSKLSQAVSREGELSIDVTARLTEYGKNVIDNLGDWARDIIRHYNKVEHKAGDKVQKGLDKLEGKDEEEDNSGNTNPEPTEGDDNTNDDNSPTDETGDENNETGEDKEGEEESSDDNKPVEDESGKEDESDNEDGFDADSWNT